MIRLHGDADMFYGQSLWAMRVSEHPIQQSLLYLLVSIEMADVAMVPNLENVWQVASS